LQRLKQPEQLVQQIGELVRRYALIEQAVDAAEQVAEQVPRPGLCGA
jgi:hypothetical protein